MIKKLLKNYNKNGYIILKNFFQEKLLKEIQDTIFRVSFEFFDETIKKNIGNIYNKNFHKALIDLRDKKPKQFGALFDTINNSAIISKIVGQEKLLKLVSQLNNVPTSLLSYNGAKIRLDCPDDNRNNLSWHQDRSYYYQNEDGDKGSVCWIPLTNVSKKMGSLILCEKSHKIGFLNSKLITKKNHSPIYLVPNEYSKKYKNKHSSLREQDLLIFKKNLIHRSGFNSSNLLRFSLQIRFHDLSEKNYLCFKRLYVYNVDQIKKMKSIRKDLNYIPKNYAK